MSNPEKIWQCQTNNCGYACDPERRMVMPGGLAVFAARTDQTQQTAQLIAEGVRFEGYDIDVRNVTEVDKGGISLNDYNAIVVVSAAFDAYKDDEMSGINLATIYCLVRTG